MPQNVPLGIDVSSENIAVENTGCMEVTHLVRVSESPDGLEGRVVTDEEIKDEQPIEGYSFSDALTPLSSPALSASELSELTELLSAEPSSPIHDWELTGPTEDMWQVHVISRPSSPVPGPSNLRSALSDQRRGSTNVQPRNGSKKGRARSVHTINAIEPDQNRDAKSKKRGRSVSAIDSLPPSPTPAASCADNLKPRKKKTKRTDVTTVGVTRIEKNVDSFMVFEKAKRIRVSM